MLEHTPANYLISALSPGRASNKTIMTETVIDMLIRMALWSAGGYAFAGMVNSIRELILSTKDLEHYKSKNNE